MRNLSALPARRRRFNSTARAAGGASLIAALAFALAACKDVDAASMTPAGAALAASAPAVSTAHVPPPPVIPPGATPASGNLAALDAQLDTTLAKASACTVDTECHAVAVGAKACGGPTGYRAYSSRSVSAASVEALAQQERDLAAQAARDSHQVSTCFMLADPGARCLQNKCVTGRAQP